MKRTAQQWIDYLEADAMNSAPAHGHEMLISGVTTVLCTQDHGCCTWHVDGRAVDKPTALRALVHAQRFPHAKFKHWG